VIKVKITVDRDKREATVDFTGTSPMEKNNFNAPEPVARAAVLYVFRLMVEANIPMNAGCLQADQHRHPGRLHAEARLSGAVVAGNVETSQHVTNACSTRSARWPTPGHDEQPHLRQRHATRTTRRSAPARRRAYDELRPRLQRRLRRPHAHDQHAPDRPGNPRNALSRSCSRISRSAKAPAARGKFHGGDGTRRTCGFSSDMDARSCRRTATARRRASMAAATANAARPRSDAATGRIETLKHCDQTVLKAGEAVIVTTPTPGGAGKL
jgi:5-oxoprolinase (ATP-hydrolysing)